MARWRPSPSLHPSRPRHPRSRRRPRHSGRRPPRWRQPPLRHLEAPKLVLRTGRKLGPKTALTIGLKLEPTIATRPARTLPETTESHGTIHAAKVDTKTAVKGGRVALGFSSGPTDGPTIEPIFKQGHPLERRAAEVRRDRRMMGLRATAEVPTAEARAMDQARATRRSDATRTMHATSRREATTWTMTAEDSANAVANAVAGA